MTMVNQALALRTKLLVAEYGRKRVIAALAQAENVEFETIEREVDTVRKRMSNSRRGTRKLPELLQEAEIDARTFPLVERIARAYENKRYLPDLSRVRRFLKSHGVDASKVQTRATALPLIVKVLGGLCERDLTEIENDLNRSATGDLGIIADQILGHSGNEPRAAEGRAREGDELEPWARRSGGNPDGSR